MTRYESSHFREVLVRTDKDIEGVVLLSSVPNAPLTHDRIIQHLDFMLDGGILRAKLCVQEVDFS